MITIRQLFVAVTLSITGLTALAQTTETTPNLITNTWNNVTNGTHPNNCCTGGPSPLYDSSTNTIHFSYGLTAVHQVQAINQALSNSGVQINGWNWGYDLRNMNGVMGNQNGTDTLSATSFITNSAGQIVQQSDQHYNTQFDWTRYAGTVNLNTPLADYGSLGIQFVSQDTGYWGGYYGPQVRNVSLAANYTVDQCTVNPQSSPTCPGFKTFYNMWDDGFARVDLPFAFPFYGNLYTTSYMYTNGVVGFLNNNWGFCCDGTDLNGQASQSNSPWNYAIYALNTDLYPGQQSRFYTQNTDGNTGMKYTWENVVEIGTNLENTFSVNIKDSGYIGINYEKVNLNPWRNPLIGIAGDTSQGQYSQYYFGQASGLPNLAGTTLTYTGTETTDICTVNPLYNSSCPGYAAAYLTQQCSINALYNTSCPGYQQAYFTQQCSLNTLYDVNCPGYATAYYNYQCSANPLYHTGCPGYEQAYFTQQCTANPLYNSGCQGYETAYFSQQCGINPLYNTTCPGYADAYYVQQCTANPLYDSGCTGYAAAYLSQQCTLDGLYDRTCPNYADAYAKKNILNISTTTSPTVVQESAPVVVASPTSSNSPQVVADPIVNQAITTTATSASPAAAATTTVPLAPAPQPAAATTPTAVAAAETKKEEKKEEAKKEETKTESASTATASTSSSSDNKNEPKTTRQALAERRLEAARAKAVEEGKNMANKMGEAATMEAQVAIQNVVVQAMGFTPGFDAYGRVNLQDAAGYKPFEIYRGQRNIDSPSGRRFMTGSDKLHTEMIESQYNFGRN